MPYSKSNEDFNLRECLILTNIMEYSLKTVHITDRSYTINQNL